uniref:Uncharacterized protein n=1 Tax=Wuchereria bancrofti TaxID=6293 RepID=A0A1I8F057_WUCBA
MEINTSGVEIFTDYEVPISVSPIKDSSYIILLVLFFLFSESEVLNKTMIEADSLSQQIHKKHDQQECDRAQICLENCGSQTDEESKMFV